MPDSRSLCQVFLEQLGAAPSIDDASAIAIAAQLSAAIVAARVAWPGVSVDESRFIAYVAARVPRDVTTIDAIARTRVADLWLACACNDRDPRALAAFERTFRADVEAALISLGVPQAIADEARQVVSVRLFVVTPEREPVIARYSGRGELRAWVRATTVRAAIDLLRRDRREVTTDDSVELDGPMVIDPELEPWRARYGAVFKDAFGDAFAALSRRERTLLRYRFVDDLDIDAIGAIYRVDRSTAARWLRQIREQLRDETSARLVSRLGVATTELDSILRFIGSALDVSISAELRR